jgi:hypothetical protein
MMKSLCISVDVISIANFATTSIIQLRNLIEELPEARDVVLDVAVSLANIEGSLAALEQISIPDNASSTVIKEDLRKAGIAQAVNRCGDICHTFSNTLKRRIEHSAATAVSLRDQISVGVWYREKIRTLKAQVQSCEAAVQIAVSSTQL